MWEDETFWSGARGGELVLRACGRCGAVCHPPLPMCPHCQSTEWTAQVHSGEAKIKSWLVSTHPNHADAPPRLVVIVQCAEGARLVSNLLGAGLEDVYEDMPVRLCFETVDGVVAPQFRPSVEKVS